MPNEAQGSRAFPPEIKALAERHGYAIGFMTTDDTVFLPVFLKVVPADELVAVHVLDGMDDAEPVLRLVMRSEQFAFLAAYMGDDKEDALTQEEAEFVLKRLDGREGPWTDEHVALNGSAKAKLRASAASPTDAGIRQLESEE